MSIRNQVMGAAGATAPGSPPDAKFNQVTMLLHGDGTNGGQNNTFVDSSSNNFTITRNGNTTQGSFSPYGPNWSNYFDGSGDTLKTSSSSAFAMPADFTIECWAFPLVQTQRYPLLFHMDTNSTAVQYDHDDAPNKFSLVIDGVRISPSSTQSPNAWYHIAGVRSGSTFTMYINGVSVATTTNSTSLASSAVSIGGNESISAELAYLGYISNIRIVKGTAVYTSNFTPSTTPLTAISGTSLLTCQSNRFVDNSTNNFSLTATGTPSVQRFSPFAPSTAYSTSVIGGSGYFDGTGDYLSAANNTNISVGTGAFTIEAWVYRQGGDADWRVMGGSVNACGFFGGRGGRLGLGRSNVAWDLESSTNVYNNNAWTHIVYVRDGSGNLSIFSNGVRVAATTGNSNDYGLNSGSLQVAAEQGGQTWIGYLSNFRLVKGTAVYSPTATTLTVPTAPITAVSGTGLLLNMTNAGIFDNAMMNDLETVGNAQISTSVKKYGTGSMYFDGTGDGLFARSTPDSAFGTGDFTVEFWINLAANLGSFVKIVEMGTTGNCFTIETQSTLNVLTVTNLTSTVYLTSSTALTTSTWIHVAVTRASGTLRIFQNGTQTGSVANTVDFPNSGGIYIGQSSTGQAMNGYIDDLRITKGHARYTANFTPPTAALSDN